MKRRIPPGWVQKGLPGSDSGFWTRISEKNSHPEIILEYAACEGVNAATGFR